MDDQKAAMLPVPGAEGLYVWKFTIPAGVWVTDPVNPALSYQGCFAAAVAETEDLARKHLERFAAENSYDSRWLAAAKVTRLPVIPGAIIGWAEV